MWVQRAMVCASRLWILLPPFVVLLLTEWQQFRQLDWSALAAV